MGGASDNRQGEEVRMTAERIADSTNWTLDGVNDEKRPRKVNEWAKAGVKCTKLARKARHTQGTIKQCQRSQSGAWSMGYRLATGCLK
jgi:hypothetical protein